MVEHTAILELVDSGEGFSRNDVTSPEASTSRIPNLCVSENENLIIIIPKHHQLFPCCKHATPKTGNGPGDEASHDYRTGLKIS